MVNAGLMCASSTSGDAVGTAFLTTHWSVVLAARAAGSPRSGEALETLCRTYWAPLYAYVRRLGYSPADAEDLTQGFFARLLEKGYLQSVATEKGRFRAFLLTALKRFVANEWHREHALKRGGFANAVPFEPELIESALAVGSAHELAPDVLFDRQWALTLLDAAMTRLREEYLASGRARLFELLQPCLAREESALPYAELASRLQLTEAAVKMAVYRLRGRYRQVLREQIAQTVTTAAEIEQELHELFSAF